MILFFNLNNMGHLIRHKFFFVCMHRLKDPSFYDLIVSHVNCFGKNDVTNQLIEQSIGDDINKLVINVNQVLPIRNDSVIHSTINLTIMHAAFIYSVII